MRPTVDIIPLQHLASGDRLSLQVYKFVGDRPGKKVYIQSNLHGNELAGNAVIHQVMDWLSQLEASQLVGEVWLVPVCNPVGVNQRSLHYATGRFSPYDGDNWNRIFWSYKPGEADLIAFAKAHAEQDTVTIEQRYRQQIQTKFAELKDEVYAASGVPFSEKYRYLLQSLCLDANYVIDLHTSVDFGVSYVYYFRDRHNSAALFGLEWSILLDWYDGDAFDEAFIQPWLALEACLAQMNRPLRLDVEAYTLELGSGMQMDSDAIARGVNGIQHYLIDKGLIVDATVERSPLPTQFANRTQMLRYYAPTGGIVQTRVTLGSQVKAGDVLYELLTFNKTGDPPKAIAIRAEKGGSVFDVAINRAVNEGEYVLGLVLPPTDQGDRHNEKRRKGEE
ncbi:succinylglutamate desuccinylase/aspartoacylase family protein [Oscillatoria sp. FACHB-1407]|uniref:succinylglutamate desuccinylase/aspartoacylase family protein n=1 Tax=Oscillatoria sp. FACHB-1407 TaxID=2692847 RepID=UPI0016872613|nr:succinylglutamate desuccinylase/aspartoacylase family protein [Oscillatoria sp. FACHB-1407]MBD2464025.1 succinylglutamate desuccinylase/aspartoacylase family protein [Oscillatoria sp. FACHB-1407]